jgi:hypothetical protein
MHQDDTSFIIYKPGYESYPNYRILPIGYFGPHPEDFFTEDIGEKGEKTVNRNRLPVIYGIVELHKLRTKNERLRAQPSTPTDIGADELPLFFKVINEENIRFGRGEVKY